VRHSEHAPLPRRPARRSPASRSTAHAVRSGRHRQPGEPSVTWRDVFAVSEFRALWSAQALSLAGDQFAQLAIAFMVYTRTGSAFLTALAYALSYLPPAIGGPMLSGLADLFPRHRLMITLDLIRAGLVAMMALPGMPFPGLCTLFFATMLLGTPFCVARSALLPEVLPRNMLPAGSAIGYQTAQLGQVAGFLVGGGLVAWAGADRVIALDSLSFSLSALILACWVRPRAAPSRAAPPRWAGPAPQPVEIIWAGLCTVFGRPVLRTLMLFGWLAGFAVVPEGLAVPYAHTLGGGPLATGLLLAAMPAGLVLGAFLLGRVIRPADRLRPMGWLAMLSCAPLIFSLLRPPLPAAALLWGVAGLGSAYQLAAAAAFVRALLASRKMHTFAVAQCGMLAAQGLGIVTAGALAGRIGPQPAVAVAGLLGLVAAGLLATDWPGRHAELITLLGAAAADSTRAEPASPAAAGLAANPTTGLAANPTTGLAANPTTGLTAGPAAGLAANPTAGPAVHSHGKPGREPQPGNCRGTAPPSPG